MTPQEQAEQTRKDRQAESRKLAMAWLACVGNPDGHLTAEQALVWADIRQQGSLDQTTVRSDPTGRLDTERMLFAEGGRRFALHIQDKVKESQEPEPSTVQPIALR